MEFQCIRMAAYIHRNAVDRIWARAIAITKAGADGVEPAVLGERPECAVSVLENGRAVVPANGETWIKRQGTFPHLPEAG
jgi:2-methylisocitrate lyase-like PEP mutase family enzyme